MTRSLRAGALCAAITGTVLAGASAQAAPAAGTLDDPIALPENPFSVRGTTAGRPSAIDQYACDDTIDESGGEVVYAFEAPYGGKLTAWVEGDGGSVDIDVHVLSSLELEGTTANDCVRRANVITEPVVEAGTVYLVVDTYAGPEQEGEFTLHVTLIGDAWMEHEPYEGVVWRARRYADLYGGLQVIHELRVDLDNPALTVESLQSNGCQTVSTIASGAGAVAAINGGYFGPNCAPVSLLKHDGELLGTNGSYRSAFGFDAAALPMIERIQPGADWPDAVEAQGGGPRLLTAGVPHDTDDYADESVVSPDFIGPNPRTVAGIAEDGKVSFFGADGRSPAAGLSLPNAAAFSRDELGLVDVVNLDGGGSTTVWVKGATPNGVVNYPSDSSVNEPPEHTGSRAVSGGFFVFSVPKNFAPVITTTPPSAIDLETAVVYDADAYDKNPADEVTFRLDGAPEGMSIDASSGEVVYSPPDVYPALVTATLIATDGTSETSQQLSMSVPGGVETTSSGAGGSNAGGSGGGGSAGDGGDGPAGDGCSCDVGAQGSPASWSLVLLAAALGTRSLRRHGKSRGALALSVSALAVIGCGDDAEARTELEKNGYVNIVLSKEKDGFKFFADRGDKHCTGSIVITPGPNRTIIVDQTCAPAPQTPGAAAPPNECTETSPEVCVSLGKSALFKDDEETASELFGKGCDAKNAQACTQLALIHERGKKPDANRAAELYEQACELDDGAGCASLGLAYGRGVGVKQDAAKAAELLEKACTLGSQDACGNAGFVLVLRGGADAKTGEERMAKACEEGSATTCVNLAVLYRDKKLTAKDDAQILRLLEKSCGADDATGCTELGFAVEHGSGTAKDPVRAATLYERGCELGSNVGCTNFAVMLRDGTGVGKDAGKAKTLFEKACKAGYKRACDLELR